MKWKNGIYAVIILYVLLSGFIQTVSAEDSLSLFGFGIFSYAVVKLTANVSSWIYTTIKTRRKKQKEEVVKTVRRIQRWRERESQTGPVNENPILH